MGMQVIPIPIGNPMHISTPSTTRTYYFLVELGLVPNRIDNCQETPKGQQHNGVGRRDQHRPEWQLGEPDAADDLVSPETSSSMPAAVGQKSRENEEQADRGVDGTLVDDVDVGPLFVKRFVEADHQNHVEIRYDSDRTYKTKWKRRTLESLGRWCYCYRPVSQAIRVTEGRAHGINRVHMAAVCRPRLGGMRKRVAGPTREFVQNSLQKGPL